MKTTPALFAIFALLAAVPAEAGVICHTFNDFQTRVKRCEDNFVLSDEAMNCVDTLNADVIRGQARVQKALAAQVAAMKNRQSGSYNTSDVSYQQTSDELNRLIADAMQARDADQSLLDEIFYPEDIDNPAILGTSAEDYMESEPCFAAPKFAMEHSLMLINKKIGELQATAVAAGIKQDTSGTRSVHVQAITPAAASNTRGVSSAGTVPSGRPSSGASDITGTKKATTDDAKSGAILQQHP
ncbi:MAG: hypothetical protein ACXWR1_12350 [Bdellovibrionota bacterium]